MRRFVFLISVCSLFGIQHLFSADLIHVLVRGETLYSLSRRYGVSVDDIITRNSVSDPSELAPGTRIIIPGSAQDDTNYTVQKGDTYYGIARSHGMVLAELLTLNRRNEHQPLHPGETLLVSSSGTETTQTVPVPVQPPGNDTRSQTAVPHWPVSGTRYSLDGKLAGVSIESTPLSYVHAVAAGSVVWTGPYRGFGQVVLVDSDGYIYLYGGNQDLFVNVGQTVAAGNRIGRLGPSAPGADKQSMIFSVFREGVPVAPEDAPRG